MIEYSNADKKILIVEDNPVMIKMLKLYLSKAGFQIELASNGEEAIDCINENIPDLIISDILMPKMDGLSFRQKLLNNPDHQMIPFIFLSAKGKTEEKVNGLKLFVDDYMVKPFVVDELVARVHTILKRHEYYSNMVKFDSMTGLLSRKTVLSELEKELNRAARYNVKMSMGLIDIDHFKNVNDSYGHTFGDKVLTEISKAIKSQLRDTDSAGRYGGEEFILVMPQTDKESADKVVKRLLKSVKNLKFDNDLIVTFSAGIVTVPDDASTIKDTIDLADKALYNAKDSGRERIILYNPQNHQ